VEALGAQVKQFQPGDEVFGITGFARSQGCVEFASDAEEDNEPSAAAHRALGFAEVGRIRCFRKGL